MCVCLHVLTLRIWSPLRSSPLRSAGPPARMKEMKIPSPSSPPTILKPKPVDPLWITTRLGSLTGGRKTFSFRRKLLIYTVKSMLALECLVSLSNNSIMQDDAFLVWYAYGHKSYCFPAGQPFFKDWSKMTNLFNWSWMCRNWLLSCYLGKSSSPMMLCRTGEKRLGEVGVRACG